MMPWLNLGRLGFNLGPVGCLDSHPDMQLT